MRCGPINLIRAPGPRSLVTLSGVAVLLAIGCAEVFSPSFVSTFFPSDNGSSAFRTLAPPTGHVPLIFENKARISDDVFVFLMQGNTSANQDTIDELLRVNPDKTEDDATELITNILEGVPVDLEQWNLPPRTRMIVDVTNTTGGVLRLQFLEGLRLARTEDTVAGTANAAVLPTDLRENTNIINIMQCDVASIEVVSVQVFVPVILRLLETVVDGDGNDVGTRCASFRAPQFEELEEDQGFNPNLDVFNTLRNYDPRDWPPAVEGVDCGGVVVLDLGGELSLPFREVPNDCLPVVNPPDDSQAPGFFIDNIFDLLESEIIPGRYDLDIELQG